jgi:hypothetical protein
MHKHMMEKEVALNTINQIKSNRERNSGSVDRQTDNQILCIIRHFY